VYLFAIEITVVFIRRKDFFMFKTEENSVSVAKTGSNDFLITSSLRLKNEVFEKMTEILEYNKKQSCYTLNQLI
jgi:hypothetical protein